ncbi:hypothetical protein ACFOEE_15605 [Pseudoalteromonas fenneropenaei]|uniref:DUF4145 domain-containing protein n=1 Tax=Pseudoalteromonas fenneropenaei TaxID=1737459 RepID=A0ABV7CMQ8_9GAMM
MENNLAPSFYEHIETEMNGRKIIYRDVFGVNKSTLFENSLYILSQIATNEKNYGNSKYIVKSIAGRCFNHGLASFRLISDHLYDESLNLTRSIAEIVNLMFLLNESEEIYEKWVRSSKSDRINSFGPAAVRKALEGLNIPCPVSREAYSELCELATHVTPSTKPNVLDPNDESIGYVGGNEADNFGREKAINKLLLYVSLAAMVLSNILGLRNNVVVLAELGKGAFNT